MPKFDNDLAKRAEAAAKKWIAMQARAHTLRTREVAPARPPPTLTDFADQQAINEHTLRKYITRIKAGKALPEAKSGGRAPALTPTEDRILCGLVEAADQGLFPLNNTMLKALANSIRALRSMPPSNTLASSWATSWRAAHPQYDFNRPRFREVTRVSAEAEVDYIDRWFGEVASLYDTFKPANADIWNFDESPLQIGWQEKGDRLITIKPKKSGARVSP